MMRGYVLLVNDISYEVHVHQIYYNSHLLWLYCSSQTQVHNSRFHSGALLSVLCRFYRSAILYVTRTKWMNEWMNEWVNEQTNEWRSLCDWLRRKTNISLAPKIVVYTQIYSNLLQDRCYRVSLYFSQKGRDNFKSLLSVYVEILWNYYFIPTILWSMPWTTLGQNC